MKNIKIMEQVLYNSAKEVLEKSEIILKVNCPKSNDEINLIKDKSILIGQFDPLLDKEIINKLIKKEIKIFSLNLLPRITRAQSMDVLSSQANLAGYRAVIESVEEFDKASSYDDDCSWYYYTSKSISYWSWCSWTSSNSNSKKIRWQ